MQLRIAGALLIGLALLHLVFPRKFQWDIELARISPLNRQMFQVHCFFIAFVVFLQGILCAFFADALLQPSRLSRVVLAGLAWFWLARLFVQFFVYKSSLWRGNSFRTFVHIAFSLLWTYLCAVYLLAWWSLRGVQ